MTTPAGPIDPVEAARRLAAALDKHDVAYAVGGALALGFWGMPRGTLDVDLTLFVPADDPMKVVELLRDIGCDVDEATALPTLREHGFCTGTLAGVRVDVFLPIVDFYAVARGRRREVDLEGVPVMIWDAEALVIFKLMFFRDRDLVDIAQIVRTQGARLDTDWITTRAIDVFGGRDPRVARWNELHAAAGGERPR